MNDNDLMAAFYACDKGAFEEIVRRWHEQLCRSSRRLGWSAEDAEELAQEALLRAYNTKAANSGRYDPALPFGPWIYRIAHNASTDRHRAAVRRPNTQPLPEDVAGQAPRKASAQLEADVEECLQGLDEQERAFIVLWQLEPTGMSQTEIAAVLGVSGSTMTRIKQSALEKLEECLAQRGYS